MEDNNYKKPEDLFGFRYAGDGNDNDERETRKAEPMNSDNAQEEGETIYSPYSSHTDNQPRATATSSSNGTYTYGPFSGGGSAPGGSDSGNEGGRQELIPVAREPRPFTVSGGGRDWESPPRRKGTSLRAVFASFMVGVVAVGGLMFAADRGNWFSDNPAASSAAASSQSSQTKANTVSNTTDTVRPNNISKIFEQASPAVVKIETYTSVQQSSGSGSWMDDPFFRQFFGDEQNGQGGNGGSNGGSNGSDDNLQESGMGSGFIFDSTGYILTNEHVIDGAKKVEVTVNGYDQPFTAEVLGSSYDLDLAVLKIEGSGFPTLTLGDSNAANMGDWVVAIGNPYGFDHTVTVGVLSSNEREISIQDTNGTRNYEHLLQTDASINPGNSGGPLLNLNGEVIGINTAVSSEAQGIGFAIPTSTISEVLENLKTNTKIPTKPSPFIGATLQDLSANTARQLGLSDTKGAVVYNVLYNSPAYNGDLRQYDVITGIDGTSYKNSQEIIDAIQKKSVGDKVTLNVIRAGKNIDISVTIGDKNDFEQQQQETQTQQ
ncbi:S1C family serine protease [Cohnella thailandensis]|uniref:Trypsin-like peptidase domain-containing protein n=1 Tax=Cohnella thailandensis TaxID=557557 RepID=A0A841SU54_9BACL|nr:trypsin-like peptidase domain-containing protein [Cohnella thailandensis]MBB6633748.1 trypsin-like peptidase domain-containing protein [Cohnella thailandensis]MBP1976536.1 S1-C subfamily serine protease [Cohnella thailandensis]